MQNVSLPGFAEKRDVTWLDIDGAKNEDVISILTEQCVKKLTCRSKNTAKIEKRERKMTMKETYLSMGIGEKTYEFCEKIEQDLKERFCEIDKVAEQNQMKVLGAMQKKSCK